MRGLALEGGGARGAYHIGVVKALMEHGYEFDGFVGTSIGAINAAILAQGDFQRALDLWTGISIEKIFDEDERPLLQLIDAKSLKADLDLVSSSKRKALKKIIDGRGISTDKMQKILDEIIDEDKIRSSGKDYGLVTISLSERKPYELMLEDIPYGQFFNYVMASASFPGFKPELIEEKKFLDGAFYDNCPYHLLIQKGYDEVIAIRTNARGVFKKVDDEKVKVIVPRDDLGSIMLFMPDNCAEKIKLGYHDGLRFLLNLRGNTYYIRPAGIKDMTERLMLLSDDVIQKAGKLLNVPQMPEKRMLFEKIIPQLGEYLKLDKDFDYADFTIALLERAAEQKEIDRYGVYDYSELCDLIKKAHVAADKMKPFVGLPENYRFKNKKRAVKLLSRYLLH
ncbi:MAG: patatin-like phospholipase family protein [Oscillospiraceae bacterium]|nr:patatin-like phospholipase family protein [Oscillospiraceae bacterium]